MPRKNRLILHQLYQPANYCQGKKAFKTNQLAKQAIIQQEIIQPFSDLELTTYKCPTCQNWHLTSKKPVQPGNFHLN